MENIDPALRSVLDSVQLDYFLLSSDFVIVREHRRKDSRYSYEAQEAVGKNICEFFTELSGMEEYLTQALAESSLGEMIYELSPIAAGEDPDRPAFFELKIFNRGPEILLLLQDITENASDRRKLSQFYNDNKLLNERLASLEKGKIEYLKFLTHDMRDRLNVMHFAAETLRTMVRDRDDGSLEFADMIMSEAREQFSKIDSLLETQDSEHYIARKAESPINIRELLEEVLHDASPQAEAKGLRLEMGELHDAIVLTDLFLLKTVLGNLLIHCLRFTDSGDIYIEMEEAGEECEIYISDSGPPVPPEDRKKLFHAYQGPPRGRFVPGGGFQMSLVMKFVRALEGKIRVEDGRRGRGLAFVLTLPLQE